VTLVSNTEKKNTPTGAAGEVDMLDMMNVVSPTDVPSSPSEDGAGDSTPSNAKLNRMSSRLAADAFVPREQYDALKQKFIENETAAKKRLESIDDLEATVKRREE